MAFAYAVFAQFLSLEVVCVVGEKISFAYLGMATLSQIFILGPATQVSMLCLRENHCLAQCASFGRLLDSVESKSLTT